MNRIVTRYWPLLGIALLAGVVLAFMLSSSKNGGSLRSSIMQDDELEDGITLSDIHYTQDDPGQGMQWVLDAEQVRFSRDRTYFSFRDFHMKLFPEGYPPLELKGLRGDYDKSTEQISLEGDLRGKSENGYRMWADRLLYNHAKGILTTDGFVRIKGPFFTVSGYGMHFDLVNERLRLLSRVTTSLVEDVLG
ncbi:MAG: LPS export ABC transporter periplasmic protein LptC [Desulfobacteraceae bacterium]